MAKSDGNTVRDGVSAGAKLYFDKFLDGVADALETLSVSFSSSM
jgi:hypothetical protein